MQKKVLEGLQGVGGTFNENKTSELHNPEILKWKKENKKPVLSNSEIIKIILIWMNRMYMDQVSSSSLKHTDRLISLIETDLYMYSVWEKIALRLFHI